MICRAFDDVCFDGEALSDHCSRPDRVWNRIPEDVRHQIIDLALEVPEVSPRELAVRFTDEKQYFVSEASVYRLVKAPDLITSPAYDTHLVRPMSPYAVKETLVGQRLSLARRKLPAASKALLVRRP